MKILLVFHFASGLAFISSWILFEKSTRHRPAPFMLLRPARLPVALRLPGNLPKNGRFGRLVPLSDAPRMCRLKSPCNQNYHKNRAEYKSLFEPTFRNRNIYSNPYPPYRLKGRQALQARRRYFARKNLIYMAPELMIVRPVGASQNWLPRPRNSGFREIILTGGTQERRQKPETEKIENQVLFEAFTEKINVSKEDTFPAVENRGAFTELFSKPQHFTTENSFRELRPSSVRPYAVKEIVDENEPIEGLLAAGNGEPFFVPYLRKETDADVHSITSSNSQIEEIVPLAERNETNGKNFQNTISSSQPRTNDSFIQINPSHGFWGLNRKPNEHSVNRQEQTKNLKIAPSYRQKSVKTEEGDWYGLRIFPVSTLSAENFRTDATPSGFIQQKTTAGINSEERKEPTQGANPFPSPVTEREVKSQQTSDKQELPEINFTPNEVTYMVREIVNVTDDPGKHTLTWTLQGDASPTPREVLSTIGYITNKNTMTPEEFTDSPFNLDLVTLRAEAKKDQESFSKNSRKMHFGQDKQSNEVDQRRSDILITDNFDDYFDEEYSLSYLEKLRRRNNSGESLKNLTSEYLIPLIPLVIQDLRQDKLPPEDISLLSEAFGDRWTTVLELSNSTNMDMLPLLKMKDETDLKNVLQSVLPHSIEPTTTQTAISGDTDYESYDYLEKFKDLYEDLLTVGQELEGEEDKRLEKRVKGWKRSGTVSKTRSSN